VGWRGVSYWRRQTDKGNAVNLYKSPMFSGKGKDSILMYLGQRPEIHAR